MRKTRVLFLCTGNSARSQMAEAFLRRKAGDRFEVHSAGLEPKGINPYTVRVMEEIGYDLSGQRAKDFTEYLGTHHFGYLITVCAHAEAHCPRTFLGVGQRIHWPIDDPAAFEGPDDETLARFREARDEVSTHIDAWLEELGIPPDGGS
jgi:arsenate reductase